MKEDIQSNFHNETKLKLAQKVKKPKQKVDFFSEGNSASKWKFNKMGVPPNQNILFRPKKGWAGVGHTLPNVITSLY